LIFSMIRKFKRLIRYPLREWPRLLGIAGLTVVASGATALQPWPLKLLADYALGHQDPPRFLHSLLISVSLEPKAQIFIITAALASLGLFALSSLLSAGLSRAWTSAGQRMVYDLATDVYGRLQRLSLPFHQRSSVGDSLSRLLEDTYSIYTLSAGLFFSPAQRVLTLLTLAWVSWKLDPKLAVLSWIAVPALAGSSLFFSRRIKTSAKEEREIRAGLLSFVHQTLSAIPIVQAFGTEVSNRSKFRSLASQAVARSQKKILMTSAFGLISGMFMTVGTALVLYVGGRRVLSGALSLGSLLVFVAYMQSMQISLQELVKAFGSAKGEEASLDRVLEILDAQIGIREPAVPRSLPAEDPEEIGRVGFENVTFGYLPGRPVLREVTLEARPGKRIALVGATGAGKSTLVSLVPRFFDPWEGRVTLAEIDVREIKLSELRSRISILLQDPFLLPLTVAENIAYGRPDALREEIISAAVSARAHDFITRLPDGYDTVIGERGATLSGGEKQRLAIARALLKDAPVLILDEPTAAVDAGTEALLLEALDKLMAGRTVLLIAHRLSTVRGADEIFVLEDGRIVEAGSHDALFAAGGAYRKLYSLQFGISKKEHVAP